MYQRDPTVTVDPDLNAFGKYTEKQVDKLAVCSHVSDSGLEFARLHGNMFSEKQVEPLLPPIGGTTPMLAFDNPQTLTFTAPSGIANWGLAVLITDLCRPVDMYNSTLSGSGGRVTTVAPGTTRRFDKINWEFFDSTATDPLVFNTVNPGAGLFGTSGFTAPDSRAYSFSSFEVKAIDTSSVLYEAGQWDVTHYGTGRKETTTWYGVDDASASAYANSTATMFPQRLRDMPLSHTYSQMARGEGVLASQRFENWTKVPVIEYSPELRANGEAGSFCWYELPGPVKNGRWRDGSSQMLLVFRGGNSGTSIKMTFNGLCYSVPAISSSLARLARLPPAYSAETFEMITSTYQFLKGGYPADWNDTGTLSKYINNLFGYVLDWGSDSLIGMLPGGIQGIAKQAKNLVVDALTEKVPAQLGTRIVIEDKEKPIVMQPKGVTKKKKKLVVRRQTGLKTRLMRG
jgi:hypothetical protein